MAMILHIYFSKYGHDFKDFLIFKIWQPLYFSVRGRVGVVTVRGKYNVFRTTMSSAKIIVTLLPNHRAKKDVGQCLVPSGGMVLGAW